MQKNIEKYIKLIQKWNAKFNLTSDDSILALKKHIEDSLEITKFISENSSVLDLGSGVGFPGIPIKIAMPNIKISLLDSRRKRISFLSDVINELNLVDTKAILGRAEDSNIIDQLGKFDFIVSKATWKTIEFLRYAQAYSKKGTIFIVMKSNQLKSEDVFDNKELNELCITLWKTHNYKIQESEKILLLFKKQ